MTARLALIEALAADGLLDRTPTDAGLRVRLRDTPDIEERTRELIAAESRCCEFLDFDLGREGGDLVLDISGPEDARPVIEMFFAPDRLDTAGRGPADAASAHNPSVVCTDDGLHQAGENVVDVPGHRNARRDCRCGAEALDVAGSGRLGVEYGALTQG